MKYPFDEEVFMQAQDAQPGIFGGILERYADEFWLLFRVVGVRALGVSCGRASSQPYGGHSGLGGAYIGAVDRLRAFDAAGCRRTGRDYGNRILHGACQ